MDYRTFLLCSELAFPFDGTLTSAEVEEDLREIEVLCLKEEEESADE